MLAKALLDVESTLREAIADGERSERTALLHASVAALLTPSRFGTSENAIVAWQLRERIKRHVKCRDDAEAATSAACTEQRLLSSTLNGDALEVEGDDDNVPVGERFTAAALYKLVQRFGTAGGNTSKSPSFRSHPQSPSRAPSMANVHSGAAGEPSHVEATREGQVGADVDTVGDVHRGQDCRPHSSFARAVLPAAQAAACGEPPLVVSVPVTATATQAEKVATEVSSSPPAASNDPDSERREGGGRQLKLSRGRSPSPNGAVIAASIVCASNMGPGPWTLPMTTATPQPIAATRHQQVMQQQLAAVRARDAESLEKERIVFGFDESGLRQAIAARALEERRLLASLYADVTSELRKREEHAAFPTRRLVPRRTASPSPSPSSSSYAPVVAGHFPVHAHPRRSTAGASLVTGYCSPLRKQMVSPQQVRASK